MLLMLRHSAYVTFRYADTSSFSPLRHAYFILLISFFFAITLYYICRYYIADAMIHYF